MRKKHKSDIQTIAHEVLETPFWPDGVEAKGAYFRTQDDCDGILSEGIYLSFTCDGDAWIHTSSRPFQSCRYRMPMFGGGRSPRVLNALLMVALDIKQDNDEDTIVD